MPRDTTPAAGAGDEAMNRALAAEEQAREAVARCHQEAATTIERAQARARAIEERVDRRISRVHARCLREAENRVGALLKQRPAATPAGEAARREHFAAAVTRLAARLTVGADEPSPEKGT